MILLSTWRSAMSSPKARANHILKKWIAELSSKDRTKTAVPENFGELVYEFWRASIPFDVVEEMMPEAIKAHLPNKVVAGITYKQLKPRLHGQSFQDFMDSWKQNISDKAYEAFYAQYPIEGVEDKEEKKFGNMSAQEYSKQRKYAESFPILDIKELRRKREEFMNKGQGENDGKA